MIPVMGVFGEAMGTVPVAGVEAAAFMARANPARARVGRTGPISLVPDVVAVHRIPVAIHPCIFWPRTYRNDVMPRRWRRPNLNSDRDLGSRMMSAKQEH